MPPVTPRVFELLTVKETAALLRVTEHTIANLFAPQATDPAQSGKARAD
jgi:hypothetical protein